MATAYAPTLNTPDGLDALPTGVVLLLTDPDGSTGIWEQVDRGLWATPGSDNLIDSFTLLDRDPAVHVLYPGDPAPALRLAR